MNSLEHVFNPLDVITGVLLGLLTLFVFKEFIVRPALDFYHGFKLKKEVTITRKPDFKGHVEINGVASFMNATSEEQLRQSMRDDYVEVLKSHGLTECTRCKENLVDIKINWCHKCDGGSLKKSRGLQCCSNPQKN